MIIRFTLKTVSSPWNEKTNKASRCTARVGIQCTDVSYVPAENEYPTISPHIFVYLWDNHKYRFNHVATPTDLLTLPLMSEIADNESPKPSWVRSDTVDLLLPEYTIADDFIKNVYADVKLLGREIGAYKANIGTQTDTIEVAIES